jgi:hypothetical protein
MKPVLKAPGSVDLKLRCPGPLSIIAFNFNLRRYTMARRGGRHGGPALAALLHDIGSAVQVDPMKPMLKPPGTKHLKPECAMLLSTFAFNFNLRWYTSAQPYPTCSATAWWGGAG